LNHLTFPLLLKNLPRLSLSSGWSPDKALPGLTVGVSGILLPTPPATSTLLWSLGSCHSIPLCWENSSSLSLPNELLPHA
jgi:hypothetical protein